MRTNRNYKDSLFTALFSDPDLLRELYCALEGVDLPPDVPVTINTLGSVLYMDLCNDISFEIGGKLVVLVEHQSTVNPNMALRLLLYYARLLESTVKSRGAYSERRLSIPRPEFFVLYNGSMPFPDADVVRLSDLYKDPRDLGLPGKAKPSLELEVKVVNINEGRNEAIVNRCKRLFEYSAFVSRVKAYYEELEDRDEAIKGAVEYCRKRGILKEFLETHGAGGVKMLLEEWNWDDAKAVWQEDAREEGIEEGRLLAVEEIARKSLREGATHEFIQKITGLDLSVIQEMDSLR